MVAELVPLTMEDFLEVERLRGVAPALLTIEDRLEVVRLRGMAPALLTTEEFLEVERLRVVALSTLTTDDVLEVERLRGVALASEFMDELLEVERLRGVASTPLATEELLELERLRGADLALLTKDDLLEVERFRGLEPMLLTIDVFEEVERLRDVELTRLFEVERLRVVEQTRLLEVERLKGVELVPLLGVERLKGVEAVPEEIPVLLEVDRTSEAAVSGWPSLPTESCLNVDLCPGVEQQPLSLADRFTGGGGGPDLLLGPWARLALLEVARVSWDLGREVLPDLWRDEAEATEDLDEEDLIETRDPPSLRSSLTLSVLASLPSSLVSSFRCCCRREGSESTEVET